MIMFEVVFNFGSMNCEYTGIPHLMEHLICETNGIMDYLFNAYTAPNIMAF